MSTRVKNSFKSGIHYRWTNAFVYILIEFRRFFIYEGGLKCLYNDIISAGDDFFERWDSSTATPMEEVCEL